MCWMHLLNRFKSRFILEILKPTLFTSKAHQNNASWSETPQGTLTLPTCCTQWCWLKWQCVFLHRCFYNITITASGWKLTWRCRDKHWRQIHVWLLSEHNFCASCSFDCCWPWHIVNWTTHNVSGHIGVMCTVWNPKEATDCPAMISFPWSILTWSSSEPADLQWNPYVDIHLDSCMYERSLSCAVNQTNVKLNLCVVMSVDWISNLVVRIWCDSEKTMGDY